MTNASAREPTPIVFDINNIVLYVCVCGVVVGKTKRRGHTARGSPHAGSMFSVLDGVSNYVNNNARLIREQRLWTGTIENFLVLRIQLGKGQNCTYIS